jgi:hypothetical protein
LIEGYDVWAVGTWLAGSVPAYTSGSDVYEGRYQSRYLSNSGRLFFNSSDALSPQDVNGTEDVYEYEPPGVGDCTASRPSYSERAGGCVGLISAGTSAEESAFLDASENGGDVFFMTTSKLLPQDFDKSFDVYDAHECTSEAPCYPVASVAPPPCTTGDACKSAPTPQPTIFGAPSSETFSGAGNITPEGATVKSAKARTLTPRAKKLAAALKVCARKPRRDRASCRKRAKARYATVRSKVKRKGARFGGAGATTRGVR